MIEFITEVKWPPGLPETKERRSCTHKIIALSEAKEKLSEIVRQTASIRKIFVYKDRKDPRVTVSIHKHDGTKAHMSCDIYEQSNANLYELILDMKAYARLNKSKAIQSTKYFAVT